MKERIWNRESDRPLQFSVSRTSGDRLWTGFDARLYAVSGGFTETASFPKHNVTMLVGASLATTCRCDGVISRRFQHTGEIDVVPAAAHQGQ
jgi:hypothetical protein